MKLAIIPLAAVLLTGCASLPTKAPQPPTFVKTEDGATHFVLPVPLDTLRVGDRVCFRSGSAWLHGTITADRGSGVFRVDGPDLTLVSATNYAGKLVALPPAASQ